MNSTRTEQSAFLSPIRSHTISLFSNTLIFRLNAVSSLKAIICHMTHFCPRWTAPHPSLNLDPLHGDDDDAIIWNQWELLGSCSTNGTLSVWRQQPPWQLRSLISEKGEERCRTLPSRRGFPSHAKRLLTDYNEVWQQPFSETTANAALDEGTGLQTSFVVAKSPSTVATLSLQKKHAYIAASTRAHDEIKQETA